MYLIGRTFDECSTPIEFYMITYDLVRKLGRLEEYSLALQECVKDLEEKNYLKLITRKTEKGENSAYKYTIDNEIFREGNNEYQEIEINFNRLYAMEKRTHDLVRLYAKVVYLTFFTEKSKIPELSKLSISTVLSQKIKEKYLKKFNDLSDVDFLLKDIELDEMELRVLQIQYRVNTFPNFSDVVTENTEIVVEDIVKIILDISSNEYAKIIRSDKKLVQYGFLEEDGILSEEMYPVLENKNLNLFFSELITEVDNLNSFELNSFSVDKSKTQIFSQMLNGNHPVSILLYGKPGSGKTEYAKALAKSTGKKVVIFKNESELKKDKTGVYKLNLLLSLNRQDTILIIDEAESVLKTIDMTFFGPVTTEKKGFVNKMLDNSQNKTIWIVNYTNCFDSSTKRRFTMSCHFDSMPKEVLNNIIATKLEPLSLSENLHNDIMHKFEKYNVTGASVDNIVKAISCFEETSDKELLDNVEVVLKENSFLVNGNSKMRETVAKSYDISVLNTSVNAEKIVKMLENAKRFAEKNNMDKSSTSGIRMLFYGLSGTGKTEFARYISEIFGKKILLKRASDIFGKYVGETEENIAKAFAEAAEKDQILLFDEADSFFSDRNNAVRNFERTQVNEFLTQMEEFPGILICTTNLKNVMDKATLRRFHITVEFKPLQEEGVEKLLKKFFPAYFNKENIDNINLSSLLSFNSVTPGDFAQLSGKIRFMDDEDISAQMIVDELCSIQEEKGGYSSLSKIGFAV